MDDLIYGVEYRSRILAFKTMEKYQAASNDNYDDRFDNSEFIEVDDDRTTRM